MRQSDAGSERNQSINSIELLFLLHTVPIGVGILGMVRFIADKTGHDAPLAVLLSGLYPQLSIVFMWLLLRRFKTLGIYDIHARLFGKWLGKLFNLVFAAYCLYASFMTMITFIELVCTWMYPMTQSLILTGILLVPTVYASYAGLRLLGRFAITTFFLTVWIALLVYFPMKESTFSHLFPIGQSGLPNLFHGSLLSALSILGFELLMVMYPYVAHKQDVLPAASIASWGMTFVYLLNAVITIMFFSLPQLLKTIWPMLTMFKHVQLPFIERFETIVIAIWVVRIVNTCSNYLWAGMEGLQKTLFLKKPYLYLVILALYIYFTTQVKGRIEINEHLNFLSKFGLALMIAYPLLLWLLSLLLRKKGEQPS
ncbi:GerAB/ArcD/ProY family transporter [Tumebacillus flagellatus]|uniref:Uncharacterized protein n=1 Tax=Tumebacillus flagellatus TaxID=1157490 RepID=A0A074MHC6_9BACL|nr:GerAB/ArcD/ProY family transporter [Tumebacillus flagellatus]KEO85077.1 hypothetical protein EL26_00505 [Tumebacillus flagellatus]